MLHINTSLVVKYLTIEVYAVLCANINYWRLLHILPSEVIVLKFMETIL